MFRITRTNGQIEQSVIIFDEHDAELTFKAWQAYSDYVSFNKLSIEEYVKSCRASGMDDFAIYEALTNEVEF